MALTRKTWWQLRDEVSNLALTQGTVEQFRLNREYYLYEKVERHRGQTWVRAFANTLLKKSHFLGDYILDTKPLRVEMTFWLSQNPTRAPDIDNLVRKVLNTVIGSTSDNSVTTLIAHKRRGSPALEISIGIDDNADMEAGGGPR